jgi:hypothetical protein
LLVQVSAPERRAQTNASESNLHQTEAEASQAEAQAAAAASTYARLTYMTQCGKHGKPQSRPPTLPTLFRKSFGISTFPSLDGEIK